MTEASVPVSEVDQIGQDLRDLVRQLHASLADRAVLEQQREDARDKDDKNLFENLSIGYQESVNTLDVVVGQLDQAVRKLNQLGTPRGPLPDEEDEDTVIADDSGNDDEKKDDEDKPDRKAPARPRRSRS